MSGYMHGARGFGCGSAGVEDFGWEFGGHPVVRGAAAGEGDDQRDQRQWHESAAHTLPGLGLRGGGLWPVLGLGNGWHAGLVPVCGGSFGAWLLVGWFFGGVVFVGLFFAGLALVLVLFLVAGLECFGE